jgi:hypothetical protein
VRDYAEETSAILKKTRAEMILSLLAGSGTTISARQYELYDGRYLFVNSQQRARCINGYVRDLLVEELARTRVSLVDEDSDAAAAASSASSAAAAAAPRIKGPREFMLHQAILRVIKSSFSSPSHRNLSVCGFLSEHVTLNGLSQRHMAFACKTPADALYPPLRPSKCVTFTRNNIADALQQAAGHFCVLYLPSAFNYKAIDALIRVRPENFVDDTSNPNAAAVQFWKDHPKALLIPIQITLQTPKVRRNCRMHACTLSATMVVSKLSCCVYLSLFPSLSVRAGSCCEPHQVLPQSTRVGSRCAARGAQGRRLRRVAFLLDRTRRVPRPVAACYTCICHSGQENRRPVRVHPALHAGGTRDGGRDGRRKHVQDYARHQRGVQSQEVNAVPHTITAASSLAVLPAASDYSSCS